MYRDGCQPVPRHAQRSQTCKCREAEGDDADSLAQDVPRQIRSPAARMVMIDNTGLLVHHELCPASRDGGGFNFSTQIFFTKRTRAHTHIHAQTQTQTQTHTHNFSLSIYLSIYLSISPPPPPPYSLNFQPCTFASFCPTCQPLAAISEHLCRATETLWAGKDHFHHLHRRQQRPKS